MSLTKRLAIMAIFLNIMLLFFCPGIAFAGVYTGLRSLLVHLMVIAPLLAFVFLIVGCVPQRETAASKAICRMGLAIVAFSLVSMAYCWDFGHNGVYELFPNLQPADVQGMEINLGLGTNHKLITAELADEETAELVALMQQITCRNPYASYRQTDAYSKSVPSFFIAMSDGTHYHLRISPPYYVNGNDQAYRAENEEICQQLADLYGELKEKYKSLDVAAE